MTKLDLRKVFLKIWSLSVFLIIISGHDAGIYAQNRIPAPKGTLAEFKKNHENDIIPEDSINNLIFQVLFVIVKRADGTGSFDLEDPKEKRFLDTIILEMNRILAHNKDACKCHRNGEVVKRSGLQLACDFEIVKDNHYWNHMNDKQNNIWNSSNKNFLMQISSLAKKPGFRVIITVDSLNYNYFIEQQKPHPGPPSYYGGAWYAANPVSHKLDHPAMVHIPNLYINYYLNKIVPEPYHEWALFTHGVWAGKGILHEILHYMNLDHNDGCYENIMATQCKPPCDEHTQRNSLDRCQLQKIYQSLMTTNIKQYVACTPVLDHTLRISKNEIWAKEMNIYGNIEIGEGDTLEINAPIYVQPGASVFVKRNGVLFLNGGSISSLCGLPWKGVITEKPASRMEYFIPGKLMVANKGKIQNANEVSISF